MAEIQQEGTTFDLKEYTTKLHEVLNEISSLRRKTLEQYVKAGKLLIPIKEHFPHGKWLPWLKQEGISPSKAEVYMKVARNPALYREADFNLANVRTNSQGLRISDDGKKTVEEVIGLIEKLEEAIHWLSGEDKENYQLRGKLDELHSSLHSLSSLCPECINVPAMEQIDGTLTCPNCSITQEELIQEEMQEAQEGIEVQERWEQLISHPAYPWSQVLVTKNGNKRGELSSGDWLRRAYSRGYDTLAQELGYQGDHIPCVGRAPSYELMPDDRFMHDLRQAFWLGLQLKNKAEALGIRLKAVDIKSRLPPKNKLLPRIEPVKFRAAKTCLKCRWHKHCMLQPKDGCSYFIRKRQCNAKQLPLLKLLGGKHS